MKLRHVYATESLNTARQCVAAARAFGLGDENIAMIAQADVELEKIPDNLRDDSPTDFTPAGVRGAIGGGSIGLLAGLAATAVPSMGITLAGAGVVGLASAAVGAWSSALMGAAIPNEVHRKFEDLIARGEILVALDVDSDDIEAVDQNMVAHGARRLDYETPAALT
jgi:hypothetical protein